MEMPKEEKVKQLEEAKMLYKEAEGMNGLGEVLLQQAKLTADRGKAEQAVKIFMSPSVRNTCGELECIEFLCDSAGDAGMNTWTAVKMVKTVLQLIKSLNASNLNVMTQKEVQRCEEHFGLHREGDPSKRVVRRKEGDRFLSLAQGLKKRPLLGNKWEMDLQDVRERIAEVLFHRVAKLIHQIRGLLHKTFVTHETCQRFLVGLPCSPESCQHKHHLPSQDSTDKLFRAILDEMSLDAQAYDFHRMEKKFANRNARVFQSELCSPDSTAGLSENLFPTDAFASCVKLLAFFFPAIGKSANIRLHPCITYLRDKKRWFHKRRLFNFAEELWKKRSTREEILSNADLFLTVSHLLQLLSRQSNIHSWIRDAEVTFRKKCDTQDNKPVIPKSVGIALDRDTQTGIALFSRWWEDSKFYLHAHGDIFQAGHNAVRRFLSMIANRGKRLPFPSPRNCLDILEYFTCVYLALFARLQQAQKSRYVVCLPASYSSVISFWDTLNCTTSGHVGIYRAALMYQSRPSTIGQVNSLLHDMVSLMLGGYSPHFNVLEKVLGLNSCIDSGEAERAVILVLTMLCNCGQSFPPDSEIRLLRNLYIEVSSEVTLPDRIDRCLKEVRQAKGIRDIVVILQDLLKERQENLCDVRWNNFHQRLWWDKVNPSSYLGSFCTDVLEKLAQATEELPAEDVSVSRDEEDSLADEFGAHVEEEPELTGDLDQSRNDKLEAIEREEALQAESWEEDITAEEAAADEAPDAEQEVVEDPLFMYFSNFTADRSGCGICNVNFSTEEIENSQYSLEDGTRQLEGIASDVTGQSSELRSSHLAMDSPHWKKKEQFEAYQKLFREELIPYLTRLPNLSSEADHILRTGEQQGRPLSILSTKMDEVNRANNFMTDVTSRIEQECNWADLESFKNAIVSLGEALKSCEMEILSQNSRASGLYQFAIILVLFTVKNSSTLS